MFDSIWNRKLSIEERQQLKRNQAFFLEQPIASFLILFTIFFTLFAFLVDAGLKESSTLGRYISGLLMAVIFTILIRFQIQREQKNPPTYAKPGTKEYEMKNSRVKKQWLIFAIVFLIFNILLGVTAGLLEK